jgi:hypothetical protein
VPSDAWQVSLEKRKPRQRGRVLLESAFLTGLFAGLLCLLPRIMAGLLALLIRLALAAALLRLAFFVLIHSNPPKFAETSFECASLKQRPYMEMNRAKHRGRRPLS